MDTAHRCTTTTAASPVRPMMETNKVSLDDDAAFSSLWTLPTTLKMVQRRGDDDAGNADSSPKDSSSSSSLIMKKPALVSYRAISLTEDMTETEADETFLRVIREEESPPSFNNREMVHNHHHHDHNVVAVEEDLLPDVLHIDPLPHPQVIVFLNQNILEQEQDAIESSLPELEPDEESCSSVMSTLSWSEEEILQEAQLSMELAERIAAEYEDKLLAALSKMDLLDNESSDGSWMAELLNDLPEEGLFGECDSIKFNRRRKK